MTPLFLAVSVGLVIAQLALPRRFAFLPLLIAGCHLGGVELFADMTTARLLILIGLLRAGVQRHFPRASFRDPVDVLFIAFSAWLALSSIAHAPDPYSPHPFIFRCGLVWNFFGAYMYARAFLPDSAALERLVRAIPLVLIPLAAGMLAEQASGRNAYATLGAAQLEALVREGWVRAQGPFKHAILAGCAGATSLPFAFYLWAQRRRTLALASAVTCSIVTLASGSSGPLAATAIALASAALWPYRRLLPLVRYTILAGALAYWAIKGRGPWHIMARIDLVGGSTGWHRSALIDQAFGHLSEWWLFGTDYTRHWMATGIRGNPNHADMTNFFLHLGVIGGCVLPICMAAILVVLFGRVGSRIQALRGTRPDTERLYWWAATALAAHALSFVAISYFDQMYVLYFLLVGAITGASRTVDDEPSIVHVTARSGFPKGI